MSTNEASKSLVPAPQVPKPWERQEGESDRAFTAFCAFRDLPSSNRTLKATAEILYPGAEWAQRKVSAWAKQFNWSDRVRAWENELNRAKVAVQIQSTRDMAKRHVEEARELQDKGREALKKIAEASIGITDARQLIIEGAKLERLAQNLPTEKDERTIRHGVPDLSNVSDEELRRLADLAEKVEEGAGEEESD